MKPRQEPEVNYDSNPHKFAQTYGGAPAIEFSTQLKIQRLLSCSGKTASGLEARKEILRGYPTLMSAPHNQAFNPTQLKSGSFFSVLVREQLEVEAQKEPPQVAPNLMSAPL
jgi:hypothetical protein